MKYWSQKQPRLFKKCSYNLAGLDIREDSRDSWFFLFFADR